MTTERPERSKQSKRPHISLKRQLSLSNAFPVSKPQPSDEVLEDLFQKILQRVPQEKRSEMKRLTNQQKWNLILAQRDIAEGLSCEHYIDQLKRHVNSALKEKRIKRKLLSKLIPLNKLLSGLEVELRTNRESWVNDFVSTTNNGHIALITLLKDLIDHPLLLNTPHKHSVVQRSPALIHLSLLCIRAMMRHRSGFSAVLKYPTGLYTVTECFTFPHFKTKTLVLRLLISVMLVTGGPEVVLHCFDHFKQVKREPKKFTILVNSLKDEQADINYQAEVLRFINTTVQTASGPNARVFYQQTFVDVGFSVKAVLEVLHGSINERISHELKEWKKNFLDVQELTDTLMLTKGRVRSLTKELEKSNKALTDAIEERESYVDYSTKLKEATTQQHNQILSLTAQFQELQSLVKKLEDENVALTKANKSLQKQVDKLSQEEKSTVTLIDEDDNDEEHHTLEIDCPPSRVLSEEVSVSIVDIPHPPPLPGSAPPPPPLPSTTNGAVDKEVYYPSVLLPTLNWVPLKHSNHTIFQDMNDKAVVEEVDFSEFEAMFQVKQLTGRVTKMELLPQQEHLNLLESRRAKGVVFAKRRVKLSPLAISRYVTNTDIGSLVPEYCELLLQIVPQDEERAKLAEHAKDFDNYGEAEQYAYELAKITRLSERLSIMLYIGTFDEVLMETQPKVKAVLDASLSIFRSSRLKKVFEIVLAFGNYMNSSRRGAVAGFKLESLEKLRDLKSTDRQQTLLHYITNMVEKVYPNVLSFYEDLTIDEACTVSMEILEGDVKALEKGLELVKVEESLEPDNFVLFSFVKQATNKVNCLLEDYHKMKDAYLEVCLMFSESNKVEPSTFFSYFQSFIKLWKLAITENRAKRRKMAASEDLLKKQTPQEAMRGLAVEAARKGALWFGKARPKENT